MLVDVLGINMSSRTRDLLLFTYLMFVLWCITRKTNIVLERRKQGTAQGNERRALKSNNSSIGPQKYIIYLRGPFIYSER